MSAYMGYNYYISLVGVKESAKVKKVDVSVQVTQIGVAPFYYDLGLQLNCTDLSSPVLVPGVDTLVDQFTSKMFTFLDIPATSSCLDEISFTLESSYAYQGSSIKFAQGDGTVVVRLPPPPSSRPASSPAPSVSMEPSASPTVSMNPTVSPAPAVSNTPTATPSLSPSAYPSANPSLKPASPSASPFVTPCTDITNKNQCNARPECEFRNRFTVKQCRGFPATPARTSMHNASRTELPGVPLAPSCAGMNKAQCNASTSCEYNEHFKQCRDV